MTKKEAIHFLYQIADEIQSFLDKTSSPKGQWTSHKRLEALSMAISALYDLSQAEEDSRLIDNEDKPNCYGAISPYDGLMWYLNEDEIEAVEKEVRDEL